MGQDHGSSYSLIYADRYSEAIKKREDYEEALNHAIKGYLIAKDLGDSSSQQMFLNLLAMPVRRLIDDPAKRLSKEAEQGHCCSFCDRKADEVKIIKGWHGSICQVCVAQLYEHLTEKE